MDEINEPRIPINIARRILKTQHPGRISKDACIELGNILIEQGILIAERAEQLCSHRKSRTLSGEDITLAMNQLEGE